MEVVVTVEPGLVMEVVPVEQGLVMEVVVTVEPGLVMEVVTVEWGLVTL